MTTTVELERMIVRLIGDGTQYDSVLKEAQDSTKLLGDEMKRLGGTEKEFERITARAASTVKSAEQSLGLYRFEQRRLQGLLDAGRMSQDTFNKKIAEARAALGGAASDLTVYNRLIQDGMNVTRGSENATERYKRKIAELDKLLAHTAISQATYNRQVRAAAVEIGNSMKDIGSSIRGVGMTWSIYLTAPITAFVTAAGIAGLEMDTLRRSLTSVAGSAKEMETQMGRLREVAKLPGLGFKEAIEGSVNLQSAGLTANLAERSLRGFGNALATVGKGKNELQMVNRALTQIMGKGKVMAQEINQVAEHLPQIRKAMVGAFGTANTEELQGMGLTAEEFITGIVKELEKLPQMTSGIKVELENLTDALFVSFSKVGDSLNSMLGPVISQATSLVNSFGDSWEKVPPWLQKTTLVVAGLVAAVGPLLIVVGTAAILAGSLTTAYLTLTATTIGLTEVQYALAISARAASLALNLLAIGAIAGVGYAIYQSLPSTKKYNEDMLLGAKLADEFSKRERDRADAVLATARAMGSIRSQPFLEKQIKEAELNLRGLEFQLKNTEDSVKEIAKQGMSGWRAWFQELAKVKEIKGNISQATGSINAMRKELEKAKEASEGGVLSKEAQENLDKFVASMREQAATMNMTSRQAKIYELSMQGVGGSTIQALLQGDKWLTRLETQKKATEDLKNKLTEYSQELNKQIATQGMSEEQIKRWELAQIGATAAQLRQVEAMQKFAAVAKLKDDVKELTTNLQKEIATVGMSSDQIKLYELAQQGATRATIQHIQALIQRKQAFEAQNDANKLVQELQQQIQTFGLSADEVKLYELALKGASQQTLALARALSTQKANMEEGKKLTEKHIDPLVKYRDEYAKLATLFRGGFITGSVFQAELAELDKNLLDTQKNANVNVKFSVEGNEAVRAGTKEFNELLANVGKNQAEAQLELQAANVRRGVNIAARVMPRMPQIPVNGLPGIPILPPGVGQQTPQVAQGPGAGQAGLAGDATVKALLLRIAEATEEEATKTPVILRPLGVGGSL